jgi:hypothetical protein
MSGNPRERFALARDAVALSLGWLLLLIIDPRMAIAVGAPVAISLLVILAFLRRQRILDPARKRDRAGSPGRSPRLIGFRARLAAAIVLPLVVIPLTACLALGSPAPIASFFLAIAVLAIIENLKQRRGSSPLQSLPLLTGLLFVLASYLAGLMLLEVGHGRRPSDAFIKKLSPVPAAPRWTPAARQQAMAAVRVVLENRSPANIRSGQTPASLAQTLRSEMPDLIAAPSLEGIHVTLYDRWGRRARGFSRAGADSLQRLLRAAAIAMSPKKVGSDRSTGSRGAAWMARSTETRIQVDVAGRARSVARRPFFRIIAPLIRRAEPRLAHVDRLGEMTGLAFEIEPGVDGLLLSVAGVEGTAVVLPADPVTHGWLTPRVRGGPAKMHAMLLRAGLRDLGVDLRLSDAELSLQRFRTTSFAQPLAKGPIKDLYRGNVLLGDRLERGLLVKRTISAADWLSRQVRTTGDIRSSGRFRYEAFPPYRRETADYNLPRHAGSVYGLFALHAASEAEPAFARAAERALRAGLESFDFITRNLGPPRDSKTGKELCFLDRNGHTSSGATALAAIAVAELPDPKRVERADLREMVRRFPATELLPGMGRCLLAMIDPDGAVFWGYREARASKYVRREPLYFPGEVMLALVRAYKRTGERELLTGSRRIGDRQLRRYRPASALGLPLSGDHWIIQALAELAEVTGEKKYARLAVLMGTGYLREQHPPIAIIYPDYRGSYYRVVDLPRTTRAASRGEALGGAVRAARFAGEDPARLQRALIEGARHLLEQQFVPANSYFIPDGFDLEGAIRMGLVDNHCRIDNNQHALIALLNALRAMDNSRTDR